MRKRLSSESHCDTNAAVQSQKIVTANFLVSSYCLLAFAEQRQEVVTALFSSKLLHRFDFADKTTWLRRRHISQLKS